MNMKTNFFLMMSELDGEEQVKFEKWLKQYEAVSAVDAFLENNSGFLKAEDAGEDIDKLKSLSKPTDDVSVEPGQIRLLKGNLTTDPNEFTCILVLSQWSGNRWLVAPFSPYTEPATQGELDTGVDFHAYQVVEAWNTVVVPDYFLQTQSSYLRDVDESVRKDACVLFFLRLEGKEIPEELKSRTGANIRSKLDPRIQYLLNEKLQLKPLRDKIEKAEEFLRTMESFESAPWAQKNAPAVLAASDKTDCILYLSVADHSERMKVFRAGNEIRFEVYSTDFNAYSNTFDAWFIVSEEGRVLGKIKGNRCRVMNEIPIDSIGLVNPDGKLFTLSPETK